MRSPRFTRLFLSGLAMLLLAPSFSRAEVDSLDDAVLRKVTHHRNQRDFAVIAAKLQLGIDVSSAYKSLDTLLLSGYGDMFWMYECVGLTYAARDVLTQNAKEKIRAAWKLQHPYRGDTENHFLMYYGSLLLMSQLWPDLPGTEWFTGKSSKENWEESKDYLLSWFHRVSREGMEEFDSPRYLYYYITPLLLLTNYSKDEEIGRLAGNTLTVLLTEYALKYWHGAYAGAHSRVSQSTVLHPLQYEARDYGLYFFEGRIGEEPLPDIAYAAAKNGDYRCPTLIREIAMDSTKRFELFSIKRSRHAIRYADSAVAKVRQYDYITPEFAMGSIEGGIFQPIQQQSWSLLFRKNGWVKQITSLHPWFSKVELGMFFPEHPDFIKLKIGEAKAGYPSEDKWVGGSEFESIFQRGGRLIAAYTLPDSVTYHHADLLIPSGVSVDSTDRRAIKIEGDSVILTISPLSEYPIHSGKEGLRLRSFASHSVFAVEAHPKVKPRPMEMLIGNRYEWLFYSDFFQSRYGSGKFEIKYKQKRLNLSF